MPFDVCYSFEINSLSGCRLSLTIPVVITTYTDAGEEQKALRHFFKGQVLVRSDGGAYSDAAAERGGEG